MRYTEKSFSVPPADLRKRNGKNTHGQTWEDIFGQPQSPARKRRVPPEPRTIEEFLKHSGKCLCATCVQYREDGLEPWPNGKPLPRSNRG